MSFHLSEDLNALLTAVPKEPDNTNVAIQVSNVKGIARDGNNVLRDQINKKGPNIIIATIAIIISKYFKFSIILFHIKKINQLMTCL
jgi:hypothetical protein